MEELTTQLNSIPTILINLDDAVERLEKSKKLLESIGQPFQRFSGVKHERGIVGCGMSHLSLLSNIKPNCLILEDDIGITEHFKLYLSERYIKACTQVIHSCLETNTAFDVGLASIHRHFNILTPNDPYFYQTEQPQYTKEPVPLF